MVHTYMNVYTGAVVEHTHGVYRSTHIHVPVFTLDFYSSIQGLASSPFI